MDLGTGWNSQRGIFGVHGKAVNCINYTAVMMWDRKKVPIQNPIVFH